MDLEPWMISNYVSGPRPRLASKILRKAEVGAKLTRTEKLAARNCLMLQCLLPNARRSGDITHLNKDVVLEAPVPKERTKKVELNVREPKKQVPYRYI